MCSDLADGQKDVILHPCLPSCLHKVNDLHTMFFTTLVKKKMAETICSLDFNQVIHGLPLILHPPC